MRSPTDVWHPGRPVDISSTVGPLRRGNGDPSYRKAPDGSLWLARRTPLGPGTLVLRKGLDGSVASTGYGPGGEWLVAGVPELLGAGDDWSALDVTTHPLLANVRKRLPGMRLARTRLVLDSLVPAVLEQRVTGGEARRAWRALLYQFGEVAPGPTPLSEAGNEMRVMPTASALLEVPTWDWHKFGVDLQRQRAIRAAATVAKQLEKCVDLGLDEALARLRVVPGIGVWTAAETAQRALGHPDAVSVGDYHLHDLVVYALSGRARGDDAEMLALLEPWQGQRQRVVRLIERSGVSKPKFGPRYAPHDFRRF